MMKTAKNRHGDDTVALANLMAARQPKEVADGTQDWTDGGAKSGQGHARRILREFGNGHRLRL